MLRIVPMAIDLVLVILFTLIGRLSHGLSLSGIMSTIWPFLVATIIGWGILIVLGEHGWNFKSGLIIWLVTWLGGLGLRLVSGGTVATSFIIVAGTFLALFLFGWRLIRYFVIRGRTA